MKELTVDPGYLHELAQTQQQAATDLGKAANVTDGAGTSVWVSHGVYTGLGNEAFRDAANSRHAAAEAMKKLSECLANRLNQAGETYKMSDQQQGQLLDNQMRED